MKVKMFIATLYFIGSLLSLINAILYDSCIWIITSLLMAYVGYKNIKISKMNEEKERKGNRG